jgi:hypothetical protein
MLNALCLYPLLSQGYELHRIQRGNAGLTDRGARTRALRPHSSVSCDDKAVDRPLNPRKPMEPLAGHKRANALPAGLCGR